MDILQTLKADYQRFPNNPTYEIYDPNVYFKDPLTEFRGLTRYQSMIQFMKTWFKDVCLTLHDIHRTGQKVKTEWTLSWTTPLPWTPRIVIPGHSELLLNDEERIVSHIDYWHCSRFNVIKQHFFTSKTR
ncbi:DUF2358 domain-containing protein [Lusitaniella coriacea]|uniref:DUF2358 domain-containing protein n=1 Tax=Lusitaniella coriacea TaxID=1983105 RepID=UPI003CFB5145